MNPGPGLRWLDALGPQKIRPGLARTRALLAALGNPQASFRTLLVGGTNGKGSTAAAAASILEAAGLRVGPDDLAPPRPRERAGSPLRPRRLRRRARRGPLASWPPSRATDALRPTYFEALVVAACELFRRARVAVGVVEVGIGGRLDATNVLDARGLRRHERRGGPPRDARARRSRTWRARRPGSSAGAGRR